MNPLPDMIRKASVLVASVDGRTAELLLSQMTREEACAVRRGAASLDTISEEEREAVIREFSENAVDISLHLEMTAMCDEDEAAHEAAALPAASVGEPQTGQHEARRDVALGHADCEALAQLLSREQPQTIATLFTGLAVQQAAEILPRLPDAVQAEVVQRLATTDRAAPPVLHDIQRALEIQLAKPAPPQEKRSAGLGLSTATRLLDAASYDLRHNLLSSLARRDAALARRLAASPLRPAVDVTA